MSLPPSPPDLFDEAGYLRLYPDVAEAVAAGVQPTGRHHFQAFGRREGRRPNDVEADFYLRSYPQAAIDIAAGRAADAAAHYALFGRSRGYRPNLAVPGPSLPALPATYPWLWTDLPHAADLIDGQEALGRLSERQAGLLRQWTRDGFVLLEEPFDPRLLAAAAMDLERGFAGACPDLRFSCGAVALEPVSWQPEINPFPAAALDLHFLSRAVRDLLFAEPLAELLGLLFHAPALLTHSRCALREAAQPLQRDAAGIAFSLPMQWVSALILLDDTEAEAITVMPGSHRLAGTVPLDQQLADRAIAPQPIGGPRGRLLLRHPALVHATAAVAGDAVRRAVMAEYCPRHVAPLYAEHVPARAWPHGVHAFTTQYYTALDPLD